MVAESTMAQWPAPGTDFDPAERFGSRSALPSAPPKACDLPALGALALYLVLSVFFFGRSLFGNLSNFYIGVGPDPGLTMWCLVWWPHAIANGLNPFVTRAIWAPSGFNLTWLTSIPLASAIASPITLTLGPVAAFNILALLSLPLDAWCAFVLCRYLSRTYWISMLGGYVFGFSAFFLGHQIFGDMVFLLVFPVPLAAYFAARRIAGEITERRFAILLAVMLIAQFLLSLEVFATMTMFGAIVLLLSLADATEDTRARLWTLLRPIACSYGLALAIVSPYLYYFFAFRFTREPLWALPLSSDLLNFLIPTQTNELGRFSLFKAASTKFGSLAENGTYLSPPLIVIAVLFARNHWREPLARLLIDFLIIACILSLGPVLRIAGHVIPSYLPWQLFAQLPVVNDVLVARFSMYVFLSLALITSLWLASVDIRRFSKFACAAAVVVFTLPNLSASFWVSKVDTPVFFRTDVYRQYLSKSDSVLILPDGDNGNEMLWQAQTDMYFVMPQGMAAPIFREYERRRWPIVNAFSESYYIPDATEQLEGFLAAHHVNAVVVTDHEIGAWQTLLSTLGVPPMKVGGVWLYKLSPDRTRDQKRTSLEMRTRFDTERFHSLLVIAGEYLSNGQSLDLLTALKVQELKLIPEDSMLGPGVRFDSSLSSHRQWISDPRLAYGLWLSSWPDHRVAVGEYVWYPAAAPMIEKLRGISAEIYYPFPDKYSRIAKSHPDDYGFLLVILTREQLARAAELLKASAATAIQQTSRRDDSTAPATR